jgi:hypothetical protein
LCQSHLYPLDGAAAQPDRADTVWPWRDAAFAQMFAGSASTAGHEDAVRGWSTGFRDALRPFAMPAEYANFATDEGPDVSRACYGTNTDRLATLKARYDPTNVFCRNHNILPAGAPDLKPS